VSRAAVRIAVIDNEVGFRAGIRHVLDDSRFELIADGATLEEIELLPEQRKPDVALVEERIWASVDGDVRLERYAVLVREPTVASLLTLLAAGALGCVPRDVAPARLPMLVEDLAAGCPLVPPLLMAALVEQAVCGSRRLGPDEVRLTRRQTQVWTLVEEGLLDPEIAEVLGLSPVTVRRHLSELSARIGAPARRLRAVS
jgi:DNA-binding NarL/FixJ family response regulator